VGTFLGTEELRLFCASFAALHLVSIGIAVEVVECRGDQVAIEIVDNGAPSGRYLRIRK
jgi:hypothetical protein